MSHTHDEDKQSNPLHPKRGQGDKETNHLSKAHNHSIEGVQNFRFCFWLLLDFPETNPPILTEEQYLAYLTGHSVEGVEKWLENYQKKQEKDRQEKEKNSASLQLLEKNLQEANTKLEILQHQYEELQKQNKEQNEKLQKSQQKHHDEAMKETVENFKKTDNGLATIHKDLEENTKKTDNGFATVHKDLEENNTELKTYMMELETLSRVNGIFGFIAALCTTIATACTFEISEESTKVPPSQVTIHLYVVVGVVFTVLGIFSALLQILFNAKSKAIIAWWRNVVCLKRK